MKNLELIQTVQTLILIREEMGRDVYFKNDMGEIVSEIYVLKKYLKELGE